ncbi:MAG: EamA family transporter [Acidobacteriota bacterium]
MSPQLVWKTRGFAAFVILSNSFGNLFLAQGMRESDEVATPFAFLAAMANPWVILGIVLLISWLLSRMAMLSWADLTYVLPVTALGYAVSAGLGHLFLGEVITLERWAGVCLIVVGTVLVGLGAPHTEPERAEPERAK